MSTQADRLAWFQDARFGMFIHWGVYSVLRNGEWVMNADSIAPADYRRVAERFVAGHFDADAWVSAARKAGMKYMVLTTKHHDGFCLWDTRTTEFNAVRSGPRRDVVAEYVAACRRQGMRVGLYWSWIDWNYPDWAQRFVWSDLKEWRQPLPDPAAQERLVQYLHAQVRELLTHYGPIDVFWFDGGFLTPEQYRSADLLAEMRALQPDMLINDRAGLPGDFGNPEGLMPTDGSPRAWELCHCSHTAWGIEGDDPCLYYPAQELLALLCDAAALGGNFLLNFGPQADGRFPPAALAQLAAITRWMHFNDEAIQGTQAGPLGRQSWGVSTRRGNTLYLHVFRPAPLFRLRGLRNRVLSTRLLCTGRALPMRQTAAGIELEMPWVEEGPAVVALELEGEPVVEACPAGPEADGSIVLTANAAQLGTDVADSATPRLFNSPDALGGKLMGWTQKEDWAAWDFVVETPGEYGVRLEFSNPDRINSYTRRLVVRCAGQELRCAAPQTGRLFEFHTYDLAGRFVLPAGRATLRVQPYLVENGALITLRAVVLEPGGQ